jgi:hypothetical protein
VCDSIGHAKAVHGVLDELNCFGCAIFHKWFVLNPLGELVNSHKDVLKTALGFLKRSYLIQPQAGEWPSGRDADKIVCWNVSLSCKHLATFIFSDEFFYVFQSSWPVESGVESFMTNVLEAA